MARTTTSSLNAHKSSEAPPPRPTIITSTWGIPLNVVIASAICSAAPSPWTGTGSDENIRDRTAATEDRHNIADRCPGARGHHAHRAWEGRQGTLSRLIEQSFSRQPLLELLERQLKRPDALRFQQLDDQLILATRLVPKCARARRSPGPPAA
jgi:hypothetical protein